MGLQHLCQLCPGPAASSGAQRDQTDGQGMLQHQIAANKTFQSLLLFTAELSLIMPPEHQERRLIAETPQRHLFKAFRRFPAGGHDNGTGQRGKSPPVFLFLRSDLGIIQKKQRLAVQ